MSDRLAPRDVDRLLRAERRWLEHARERLRRPAHRPDPLPTEPEETDR